MKVFRTLAQKYVIIFSLAIILIALFTLSMDNGSGHVGMDLIVGNFKGRLPASLFMIVVMYLLGFVRSSFTLQGLTKGFAHGWALILVGTAYFFLQLFSANLSTIFKGINVLVVVAIVFDMLCVGLFEELLMRGIVFRNMSMAWGDSKNGLYKSTLVSSVLFGLIHLMNYSDGLIIATASQVIYTTFIGTYLCGVFIKSKYNLLPIILLHAVFDFITLFLQQDFMDTPVTTKGCVEDISLAMGLLTIIATFPLFILGLRYVKQGASIRISYR